jgi:HAMP domain-containing protein
MRLLALLAGSALLVIVVLAPIVFFATRRITRPLQVLSTAMQRLAHDEVDVEIGGAERRDEIGAMAGTVVIFKDNMIKARALAAREAEAAKTGAALRPPLGCVALRTCDNGVGLSSGNARPSRRRRGIPRPRSRRTSPGCVPAGTSRR